MTVEPIGWNVYDGSTFREFIPNARRPKPLAVDGHEYQRRQRARRRRRR